MKSTADMRSTVNSAWGLTVDNLTHSASFLTRTVTGLAGNVNKLRDMELKCSLGKNNKTTTNPVHLC
ncbi:hypothetical protein DPMN_145807 [Dreissena polymorpha]|uniref:Uncharacterized protein n=1 Tax=Dreissena polymorpha TaxID=45954 RepID=A0A9D4F7G2_DREPO|nr:hypothetical protein DPMN_145807 [Dreissena polymorpha]